MPRAEEVWDTDDYFRKKGSSCDITRSPRGEVYVGRTTNATATSVPGGNRPAHGSSREYDRSGTAPQRRTTRRCVPARWRSGASQRTTRLQAGLDQAFGQTMDAGGKPVARRSQSGPDQWQATPRSNPTRMPRNNLSVRLGGQTRRRPSLPLSSAAHQAPAEALCNQRASWTRDGQAAYLGTLRSSE